MESTMKDVAKLAGISLMTVSRVLDHRKNVAPETRGKVRWAIKKLHYRPHRTAIELRTKRSNLVGVVMADIANPFYPPIVRGIEDVCREHDYNVILCNTDEDTERENDFIQVLKERYTEAIIICSAKAKIDNQAELFASFRSTVFLNRRPRNVKGDLVVSDNFKGAYLAVEYLIKKGHQKIAVINGSQRFSTGRERFQGVKKALRDKGVQLKDKYVKFTNSSVEGGYRAAKELLNLPSLPTAIFSGNNFMTLGLMKAIKEARIKVPDLVSIVGFDETSWSEITDPPLTTIKQPTYEIGVAAAKLIMFRLNNPQSPYVEKKLKPTLIIRDSVKQIVQHQTIITEVLMAN